VRRLAPVFAVFLAACASTLQTLPPISTDRPDVTDGATTVPVGTTQLEGGYTTDRSDAQTRDQTIGEGLVRIGLSSRAEARLAFNSYEVRRERGLTQRGFDDASLGVKLRLYDAPSDHVQALPTTSWIFALSIPTGNRDFGARTALPSTKLAAEWSLGERVGLGANAILAAERDETGRHTQSGASVSLGPNFTEQLGGFLEWYAFRDNVARAHARHSLDAGLTFAVGDDFQLDVRYGGDITRGDRDRFFGVGIARRWPR
jgi:hypothetical protein